MLNGNGRGKLFPFFVLLSVFFAVGISSFAEAAEVSKIRIEGNRRVSKESVELLASQKVGATYDESKTAEDIKKIYSTGNFYDVTVEKVVSASGVELIYIVKENPVLVDFSINGNKKIKDEEIKEVLEIEGNQITGTGKLHDQLDNIARLYTTKGYSNAQASYDIEPEAGGGISVSYNIEEGQRETISSVKIEGNNKIKTKKIKKSIFSSPRRFYSLGQKGLFVKEEVQRDLERIKFIYLNEGYLDVQVSAPKLKRNLEENSYEVSFKVSEGQQYFVAGVSLEGMEAPPEVNKDKIFYTLNLKEGKPYGNGKLTSDISILTSVYSNQGYANVNVEPSLKKQLTGDGKPGVFITFTVEKGKIFYFGRLNIDGNDKTVDKVIRRQLPFAEGDIYRSGDLSLIKPLVGRIGFFDSEATQVSTEVSKQNPDELDVNISIRESSTAQFNLGAGVSSIEDFIFFGSVQEANLFGYGKTVSASASFGGITDSYSFRYADRNFLDTNWSFDISLSRIERDYVDYDTKSTGSTIGIGRSLYQNLWGRVYYRWENLEITNPSPRAVEANIMDSRGILSAVGADINWDKRDNYQFPRSGYRTSLLYEHSGPFGGDTDLSKLAFENHAWIPLLRGSFLSVKIGYSRVFIRGESNSHAIDERLFLGGPSNLRGFDYRDLSVGNSSLGGTERIYGKTDLVIPLFEPLGLFGVLFYDIGNVFDSDRGSQFSTNPSDLRQDYGYGFWWRSPLGLIKIEFGYPIDREPFEEKMQLHFSIGASL